MTVSTLPTTDAECARVRDDLGRELYRCRSVNYLCVPWEQLSDNRREEWRNTAVAFVTSETVDAYLEAVRRRIAA